MTDIRKPLNVVAMTPIPGALSRVSAGAPPTMTVQIIHGSSDTFYPTYPVTLATGTGPVPKVALATVASDVIYGLVLHNPKQSSWVKDELLQITTERAVVWLTASVTLTRGQKVGLVAVGATNDYQLIVATGTNSIGLVLKDAAVGDIVEVEIVIQKQYA